MEVDLLYGKVSMEISSAGVGNTSSAGTVYGHWVFHAPRRTRPFNHVYTLYPPKPFRNPDVCDSQSRCGADLRRIAVTCQGLGRP